jgi:hypothetical protein
MTTKPEIKKEEPTMKCEDCANFKAKERRPERTYYWYSEEQRRRGGYNLVNVGGKWIAYTEMSTSPDHTKSNFDDAVTVWEGTEALSIRCCKSDPHWPWSMWS